ncbi:hypothetical protein BS50DRAFT_581862 [Corynespora cassiicola Philippines]|uniref:Uncharacterized protein n=1 Tax=Corynespora cassiicola Philippines TaxID=1448308 RepID=A0A2T2PBW5_CORCC|nr:hypothetical protein BS50DRAFT_581862 [Corynespora cassiicola Philippines]
MFSNPMKVSDHSVNRGQRLAKFFDEEPKRSFGTSNTAQTPRNMEKTADSTIDFKGKATIPLSSNTLAKPSDQKQDTMTEMNHNQLLSVRNKSRRRKQRGKKKKKSSPEPNPDPKSRVEVGKSSGANYGTEPEEGGIHLYAVDPIAATQQQDSGVTGTESAVLAWPDSSWAQSTLLLALPIPDAASQNKSNWRENPFVGWPAWSKKADGGLW